MSICWENNIREKPMFKTLAKEFTEESKHPGFMIEFYLLWKKYGDSRITIKPIPSDSSTSRSVLVFDSGRLRGGIAHYERIVIAFWLVERHLFVVKSFSTTYDMNGYYDPEKIESGSKSRYIKDRCYSLQEYDEDGVELKHIICDVGTKEYSVDKVFDYFDLPIYYSSELRKGNMGLDDFVDYIRESGSAVAIERDNVPSIVNVTTFDFERVSDVLMRKHSYIRTRRAIKIDVSENLNLLSPLTYNPFWSINVFSVDGKVRVNDENEINNRAQVRREKLVEMVNSAFVMLGLLDVYRNTIFIGDIPGESEKEKIALIHRDCYYSLLNSEQFRHNINYYQSLGERFDRAYEDKCGLNIGEVYKRKKT